MAIQTTKNIARGRLRLSRNPGEEITLRAAEGIEIRLVVESVRGRNVVLSFDAPRSVEIARSEVDREAKR